MNISDRLRQQINAAIGAYHNGKSGRLIISHANCPDGTASAMIARAAGFARIHFAQYGHALPPVEGAIFVDFAPPANEAQAWLDAGAIVLDHHKSARAVVERFVEVGRGAFADESIDVGVSGAVLAEFVINGTEPTDHAMGFARLAGIRDTWQKDDPDWRRSCAQAAALVFYPWEYLAANGSIARTYVDNPELFLETGELLLQARERDVEAAYSRGFFAHTALGAVFVCNEYALSSDIGELARVKCKGLSDVTMTVCFRIDGEPGSPLRQVLYSLRAVKEGFDVAAIAKRHGGGGHSAAAGFKVEINGVHALDILAPFRGA